ncbi:MBOAT family O-acyltransferase [Oceanirhabdus sp. W0125-5]|uniref:MBOAT family O-acyltransferase n=1 Tax=Oceanirhabdus sp. W0125-5 TaxID=2999116 RepID=UPI0022F2D059|nr:MBOAT family O-acyltransferase [Oceanirhabdus sp. W0125-5]WBW98640.1 MBOAT family protein [Oceanirhabdus sp. W0125-5]
MLFNSFEFFIFFPLVTIAYFIIPHKYRWALLLGASYYFYMVLKPEYIILIIISTVIDYFASIMMEKQDDKKKRKKFLYLSLVSNLGLLFFFKYFNFFNDSIRAVVELFNLQYSIRSFDIFLPMGISFYTFQTLSYTIDVYRGRRKAERNFGIFALYVTFFPQLVAGPIERSDRLLPQFYEKHEFDYDRVVSGLRRMLWGFFKKMVIADKIAVIVDKVYDSPQGYSGFPLILATVCFAIQIYCDFSGYSDIAIGSARILGFNLMENFKTPYFSKSISEFWKRWHISLSSWFKDYVYIPLGGNKVKIGRVYFNLFITFLISGLWHGTNWTFVIWGALHGVYLIIGRMTKPVKNIIFRSLRLDKIPVLNVIHGMIQRIITFSLVCYGWIFFRGNSINDAMYISKNIFKNLGDMKSLTYIKNTVLNLGLDKQELIILFISVAILFLAQLISKRDDAIENMQYKPILLRWGAYYFILIIIVFFGVFKGGQFMYFQF